MSSLFTHPFIPLPASHPLTHPLIYCIPSLLPHIPSHISHILSYIAYPLTHYVISYPPIHPSSIIHQQGRSVLLTSPTVATVGLTLTIPMAIIVDLIAGNTNSISSPLPLVGAALVVVGFIVVNVGCETCCEVICRTGSRTNTEEHKQQQQQQQGDENDNELEFQVDDDDQETTIREDNGRM